MGLIDRFQLSLLAACLLNLGPSAFAQGSAFTYQGKLTDGGAPATGAYDFRFILYNADAGGSQVGTTLTADDVVVTTGAFTVVLDFGPNIFDGQARWLELAVRQGASTGIYTVLSPRQPVTPAPYAMFASKAGGLANGSITSGQLAPGAVTAAAIASGAITADKIPDGVITTNKLSATVLAGLGGTPSSAVLMSQDPNATNLTSAGYVRLSGELLANQSEVLSFAGPYQPTVPTAYEAKTLWTGSDLFHLELTTNSVGFRYNLASNRIDVPNATGAPSGRDGFSAVWTGTELIAWGGRTNAMPNTLFLNTGARYRPSSDTWQPMTTTGAPAGRSFHSAVWTGTEMIVWGGISSSPPSLRSGGRYNPTFDSWLPMSTVNAPGTNGGNYWTPWVTAWTGTRLLVWSVSGGTNSGVGGLYDPTNDSWLTVSTINAPILGGPHGAVWTGTHLVVYDYSSNRLKRYSPATNIWETLPAAPDTVGSGIGVWTGSSLAYFQDYGGGGYGVYGSVVILDWASLAWTAKTYSKPYGYSSSFVAWVGDSALHFNASLTTPLLRSRLQSPLYLYLKP